MFTCFIRYYIDSDKFSEFKEYARAWIFLIQKHGAIHHGYFIPGTEADHMPSAALSFPSKEAYEQYRVSVANDDLCKAATARFEETKCFSSYERTFLIPMFE